jgi:hypothetical protein
MSYCTRMRTHLVVAIFSLFLWMLSFAADPVPEHGRSSVQMTKAAQAFIESLDNEQRKATVFSLDVDERATWSNLPIIMVEPNGMLIGDMNEDQRVATHQLLRASLSSQGYAKFTGIMQLDDLLHEIETEQLSNDSEGGNDPFRKAFIATRSSGNYVVAIFGEPGAGDWGWKLAGHHAAVSFTVSDGRVGFTPTFLGSSPMTIDSGRYAGWMALPHEGSRGIEFMQSLTEQQQQAALIHAVVADDVFEGPGRRASLSKYEGLKADELSVQQMRLLQVLVSEYVRNVDFDTADAQLELIAQTGWDELWFSWRGAIDQDGEFYYRVHGPRLLIEYNRQNANHDHIIVRDPQNDYGEDWLETHYKEYHPTLEEAMETARRRATSEP